MKKLFIMLFAALFFAGTAINAQQIFAVPEGTGTLNDAIDTYGGTRIYQLKAGGWYQLSKIIENVSFHLQIIGAEPAVAGGMPATLQTANDANNVVFGAMFNAKGNITIKNVYIVNADLNGTVGDMFLIQSAASSRIIIDRCVLHPAGVSGGITGMAPGIKTYFTNNQVIDFGHQVSPNDGHFFLFDRNPGGAGLDSLYVENNTFVCIGTTIFFGSFGDNLNNVINFNHNTFCMTKSQLGWSTKKNEEYWTNNLMFDVQTQPFADNWINLPGSTPGFPKPNLIFADTLPGETLPSLRPNFVQYNSHYRAKGFYDLVTEFNSFAKTNKLPGVYLFPLTWSQDSLNCREAQMFNGNNYPVFNKSNFPNFKYGNTITDVDPKWVDQKIYTHENNFIEWTRPATYIHALNQPANNYPPASQWKQYWWIPSNDLAVNDVWPVFNGAYTNPQTLVGSIEGLPLGDLNWFPNKKAIWQSNKTAIEAHIKSGSTDKMNLTAVAQIKTNDFVIYPNPASDLVTIKGVTSADIIILSIDGRIMANAKNTNQIDVSSLKSGSYLVNIKEGNKISNQKLNVVK